MEKTCKTCIWGKDGVCQKPNRQPNDSMAECYVDPTEVKEVTTKHLDTRSWDNAPQGIEYIPVTKPIVWEDNEKTMRLGVE